MPPRKQRPRPRHQQGKTARRVARKRVGLEAPTSRRFVGRAGSPVLDKYPPKAVDASVTAAHPVPLPPTVSAAPGSGLPPAAAAPSGPTAPMPLISLERPFDPDDFSQLLGQTQIQVTVPRESLAEVLRRACDFMGFGIYVYTIRVRPGPEELLKTFIVELQRVDYSNPDKDWTPFQEKGRADNPFGPTGTR